MRNGHRKNVSKRHLLLAVVGFVAVLILLYVGTSMLENSQRQPEEAVPVTPYIPSDAVEVQGNYYLPRHDVLTMLLYGMEKEGRVTFANLMVIDHGKETIAYLPLNSFLQHETVMPGELKEKAEEWLPLCQVDFLIGAEADNMRSLLQLGMDISAEVLEDGAMQIISDDPALQMMQLIRLAAHMQSADEQDMVRLVQAVEQYLTTDMATGRMVNELWKSRGYDFQGEQVITVQDHEDHMLSLFWQPLE